MTIAIGMLCDGGVILAADTRITNPSTGATYDAVKIQQGKSDNARYVAAYSSESASSGESLRQAVISGLEAKNPKSLAEVSPIVENTMAKWSKAYTLKDDRPSTEIVLGAFFGSSKIGLFLCEPPKTVVRKTFQGTDGYVASGAGQAITDPLFRILFSELVSPRVCLCRIAYLMHRAKTDYAAYCGGETDVVFLKNGVDEPIWIERLDMKQAEEFGDFFDSTLSLIGLAVMSDRDWDNPKEAIEIVSTIANVGLIYRKLKFHSRDKDDSVVL
jgi:hypothetical protein